jgi:hypothetical protein
MQILCALRQTINVRIMYVMAEKIVQIIEHDMLGREREWKEFLEQSVSCYRVISEILVYKNTKFYSVSIKT